ncbi:amidase [Pseudoroseomonas wenyumeiae]|uniref:Amidase n=1 Tax=Teichococcus wenyumeiae TaxID=2478470 RepID=A0A3A9JT11_9PROT|nr:amidase [Pseudoroseomonas wenyumeiae]RKK03858.1 amidase [Pseudoroseomonas wenyumeiae]RMI17109.1 amidase [Pseudoroseomonas wenyumeiae]
MTQLDEICYLSAAALGRRYAKGELSPVDVAEQHLARLEALEPALNAFQLVDREGALAAAREAAGRWERGEARGPLDGVPVTIKDNVDMKGWPTRNGSTTSKATPVAEDAPVVARLREEGAVFLGKTTTPEFAWKGITDSQLKGFTRNPWALDRSPGGSSGGAAAALAAGIGTLAYGNDGGGSIRIPSAFCGLFGIKPTFGRVPHHPVEGVFATVSAGGPLARHVADAALALQVMARPDRRDWYALPQPPEDWLAELRPRLRGLRFAYAPNLGEVEPDQDIRACLEQTIARLREAGATVEEVGPVIRPLPPVFQDFWMASFAHLLRGVPRERWDELDPNFRDVAERGLAVSAEQVVAGEVARARLHRHFAELHARHDLLLTPTTPHAAPPVETLYHSPAYDRWRDGVAYTLPFNLTGQPAASIFCGVTGSGLPVGLQIAGPKYGERLILEASLGIEALQQEDTPHPRLMAKLEELVG